MYLSKRGNTYYIRFRNNGVEIKRSLQTSSKRIATLKVREILEGGGLSSLIKYNNMDLAAFIRKVQEVVNEYQERAQQEFSELESLRFKDIKRFDYETINNKIHDYSDIVFDYDNKQKLKPTALPIINRDDALKNFLKELKEKEEQELFYEFTIKSEVQVLKNDLQRTKSFQDTDHIKHTPKQEKVIQQQKQEAVIIVQAPPPQNTKTFSVENLDELEGIFQKFMDDEKGHTDKHTQTEHKANFRLLKTFIKETNYSLPFSFEAKREFQDTIRHFPKNQMKLPEQYKTLPIKKLLELTQNGTLEKRAVASQQKQAQEINDFFRYLERDYGYKQEKITTATNKQKYAQQKDKKDNKRAFSNEELTQIFTLIQAQKEKFPERYWLVWLHLFTGMRTNEIAQLTFENIVQNPINKIWYIDITPKEPFQKIKIRTSKRKVPIHSFLIELGFLKFYNKRLKEVKNRRSLILPIYNKSGKTVPLFELTKPPSKDFCDAVADWFNEHILEKQLGIKSPEISIYCLRHTFKDAMSRFNPSEIISELVGHKAGITTTETVYGTERALVLKKEAIEKLWFETFDFNSFKK